MSTSSSKDQIHNTVAGEPHPARKDRPSADAPDWEAAERSAALLCELHLSSRELDKIPPRRRQGRMASRRTLSACRLYSHQHEPPGRARRCFLQQARDVRAMDQEGKGAIKWTRLSCRSFAANAVRLQLHALAYNLGNFLRTLATPEPIKEWSLTSLKEKLIKIGAKIVSHGRLCRVSDGRSRHSQKSLCRHSADDRGTAAAARCIDSVMRSVSRIPSKTGGKVRLDDGKFGKFSVRLDFGTSLHSSQTCPRRSGLANNHEQTQSCLQLAFIWRMSVYMFVSMDRTSTFAYAELHPREH